MNNKRKLLVSDANHGGLTLIKEYSKYSDNDLYFYDTYDKLTSNEKKKIEENYDVTFLDRDFIIDNIDEFITVNPVHMPDIFNCDYTHHEFTGYLLNKHKQKYGWDFKIIEITGVKGKTTTTHIISDILENYNTLVLSSDSLVYKIDGKEEILSRDLSITPASIITSLNIALDNGLLYKIDYFICEVSLGITTNCDIGVLTNIIEDYPIADNNRSAASAKRSVFESRYVVCDKDTLDTYYGDIENSNITTVSLDNKDSDIYATSIEYNLDKTRISINYDNSIFSIETFALSDFYIKNILLSIAVALVLDVERDVIIENMKNVKTIEGRGSCNYVDDKIVFEDINSGINTTSIRKCIENVNKYSDDFIVILGGDYGITCEEIDEKSLCNYIETLKNDNIILTGKLGYNLNKKLRNDYKYFENLSDAFNYTRKSNQKIIQIIYRSEYDLKRDYLQ